MGLHFNINVGTGILVVAPLGVQHAIMSLLRQSRDEAASPAVDSYAVVAREVANYRIRWHGFAAFGGAGLQVAYTFDYDPAVRRLSCDAFRCLHLDGIFRPWGNFFLYGKRDLVLADVSAPDGRQKIFQFLKLPSFR